MQLKIQFLSLTNYTSGAQEPHLASSHHIVQSRYGTFSSLHKVLNGKGLWWVLWRNSQIRESNVWTENLRIHRNFLDKCGGEGSISEGMNEEHLQRHWRKTKRVNFDPERLHVHRVCVAGLALHGQNRSSLIVIGEAKESMGEI